MLLFIPPVTVSVYNTIKEMDFAVKEDLPPIGHEADISRIILSD